MDTTLLALLSCDMHHFQAIPADEVLDLSAVIIKKGRLQDMVQNSSLQCLTNTRVGMMYKFLCSKSYQPDLARRLVLKPEK